MSALETAIATRETKTIDVMTDADAQSFAEQSLEIYDGALSQPVEEMRSRLAEYDDRRNAFLQWLLGKMKEGVHYGFPPGCRPARTDPRQWKAKPSLYKAGAQLIVDLLRFSPTFEPDVPTWTMLGGNKGDVCMLATLWTSDGHRKATGRGVMVKGEKKMNPNACVKMAQKRALVDAVITAVPCCADLFTQDLESTPQATQPEHETDAVTEPQLARLCSLAHDPRLSDDQRRWIVRGLLKHAFNKGTATAALLKIKKAAAGSVEAYAPPENETPHPKLDANGRCDCCGLRVAGGDA